MDYFEQGSPDSVIDEKQAGSLIDDMLAAMGNPRRVLLLPPDYTRRYSWAGTMTGLLYDRLKDYAYIEIMPALGTHAPMSDKERRQMFPGIPADLFQVHNWRDNLVRLGEVPGTFVREITAGKLDYPVACEVNRRLADGNWDRIISIGQLVPHEVVGIANHAKNVFVGVGGQDTINKTHFIGAVCGMESVMGRPESPVRSVFRYMSSRFLGNLPLSYLLTVRTTDAAGNAVTCGLYAGDDDNCFLNGAGLCREVNVCLLDKPITRAVVYLDPDSYKSAWLGNKAIYRMRMAMADGGELTILAPGVSTFGEDPQIDRLIRKYGYRGTEYVLAAVGDNQDLAGNLSAAAHLIHGSTEGRFKVTLCAGGLSRQEVESVGFDYRELDDGLTGMLSKDTGYGWREMDNTPFYYVSDPGRSLWTTRQRFAL